MCCLRLLSPVVPLSRLSLFVVVLARHSSRYLDLRRFGTVPHAGYGLGFERLVCYITAIENIRDAIAYPRYPGSAEF